ncbi:hypothetical protein WDW86_11200 [Bdellovibrionota bacterium FG-2]
MSQNPFTIASLLVLLLFLLPLTQLQGAEVDAFTRRTPLPQNSALLVNQVTTRLLQTAVTRLNQSFKEEGTSCIQDLPERAELRRAIGVLLDKNFSDFHDEYYKALLQHPALAPLRAQPSFRASNSGQQRAILRKAADQLGLLRSVRLDDPNNIYQPAKDKLVFSVLLGKTHNTCCSDQVNIGGHYVGLDKIGHFFESGYDLYRIHKNDGLKAALDYSVLQEEGGWGLSLNGVKSYGDLAANYDGMRFWQWLLDGPQAAMECRADGTYALTKAFQIEKFTSDAWDEGINCSSFDPEIAGKVIPLIQMRTLGKGCPVSEEACARLNSYYPEIIARRILHPACVAAGHRARVNATQSHGESDPCPVFDPNPFSESGASLYKKTKSVLKHKWLNDTGAEQWF